MEIKDNQWIEQEIGMLEKYHKTKTMWSLVSSELEIKWLSSIDVHAYSQN